MSVGLHCAKRVPHVQSKKKNYVLGMRDLPHFLIVKSEGISYMAFLFVPGCSPVCFQCGGEGHMKSKWPQLESGHSASHVMDDVMPEPAKECSRTLSVDIDQELSESESVHFPEPPERPAPGACRIGLKWKGVVKYLLGDDKEPIVVCPPIILIITEEDYETTKAQCKPGTCWIIVKRDVFRSIECLPI